MEANSSRSEQSAESRGQYSENMGSRSCGQLLVEASESCSSPEDLASSDQKNWKGSHIRSLSYQLIHSTKVTE